jgi:hypothetical protein
VGSQRYSYLLQQAEKIRLSEARRYHRRVDREKAQLREALDAMVARGEIRKTEDGKYYLPDMKPYRIQNDIVAAKSEQQAIEVWAKERGLPAASAGPVEEVLVTVPVNLEDDSGGTKPGTLADCMPGDNDEPRVVAFGECEHCER